jgi:hypothetical protein
MIGEQVAVDLRDVPSGEIGVDAAHQRRVVAHLRRQRIEQMTHALLVLHVHVKIAEQGDAALGADTLAPTGELARFHEPLHMLTPSFWSKDTPDTSSKQTTSYWQTSPRCPVVMLTNIRATVAFPPEPGANSGTGKSHRFQQISPFTVEHQRLAPRLSSDYAGIGVAR